MKRFVVGEARDQSTLFPALLDDFIADDNPVRAIEVFVESLHLNVEFMWLTERLTPDFKTIADFRKDNGEAIRRVCREFIVLCRRLDLFSQAIVAINGSKFKTVNNRNRNFTATKMKRRLEQIEESFNRYLGQLDAADRDDPALAEAKTAHLKEKITKLREETARLQAVEEERLKSPDKQVSLTDPGPPVVEAPEMWVTTCRLRLIASTI